MAAAESLYYAETSDAYFPFLNRLLSCPGMLHLCEALKKAVVIPRCSDQPSLSLAVVNGINPVGISASILSAVSHLHASFHKFFSYLRFPAMTVSNLYHHLLVETPQEETCVDECCRYAKALYSSACQTYVTEMTSRWRSAVKMEILYHTLWVAVLWFLVKEI